MPPQLASLCCASAIVALFLMNRDSKVRVSIALWIPTAWIAISASRFVSQWLSGTANSESADQLVEGSPLDAMFFLGLLLIGLVILARRHGYIRSLIRSNKALLVFFLFCFLSILWSDFPMVAFKRWIKALGDLVMILLVLTEQDPTAATKKLFARIGFVLVPVSILVIRYYPTFGRAYSYWTGEAFNIGVATGKNGLGYVCLICGIGAYWALLEELRTKRGERRLRVILAQSVLLGLTLWLFHMAHSATSFGCFIIGSSLITLMSLRGVVRRPVIVYAAVTVVLFVAVYGLLINPQAGLAETVGRDSTLTGRTTLWSNALTLAADPFVGAGYESFWLGKRLERMWQLNWEHPNQAHNGYLEIYLDLGWIGVFLLATMLLSGLFTAVREYRKEPQLGKLKIAFFAIAAVYNLTEHAFRELHPVWIMLLLAITAVPKSSKRSVREAVRP